MQTDPLALAKTHQILSRFRPIAPKPPLPTAPSPALHLRSRPRKRPRRRPPPPTPIERDLLRSLQHQPNIIVPRPVRPVDSTISVSHINHFLPSSPPRPQKAEEVMYQVEAEALPAVVSDRDNRVRMANSAYKELVGQPECVWLDFVDCGGVEFGLRPLSRRINGEVAILFSGGWGMGFRVW